MNSRNESDILAITESLINNEEYIMPRKRKHCGPIVEEVIVDKFQDEYTKFLFENITVTHPPMLKVFYWEYFDIDGLNERLVSTEPVLQHNFHLPARQLNSRPLKVIFWIRNSSKKTIDLNVKRVKNCECQPMQTRVGYNQYRQLYHCPHRRLVNIAQEHMHLEPNDLVAMTMTFYFFVYGDHHLTYQIICSDSRILVLNIYMYICSFSPEKCIVTKNLIPVYLRELKSFVQPIWVSNISMDHLNFNFESNENGFHLINTNLAVPRQSIWPLMVEYRPNDVDNMIELKLNFESTVTNVEIEGKGSWEPYVTSYTCPEKDYECVDYLYTSYPNRIDFNMKLRDERFLIVAVTNFNQKCAEFRWQNYIINDYLAVNFEPLTFRLKPHHSKLCLVTVRTFDHLLNFQRIPTVLEVHRVLNKATRIAKELLTEIESIDDPKWKEDSFITHTFFQVNIVLTDDEEELCIECVQPQPEEVSPYTTSWCIPPVPPTRNTVFEKLFWEYLSRSDFMRERKCSIFYESFEYEQVFEYSIQELPKRNVMECDKESVYRSLSKLLWAACTEISKNWRFVPPEQSQKF